MILKLFLALLLSKFDSSTFAPEPAGESETENNQIQEAIDRISRFSTWLRLKFTTFLVWVFMKLQVCELFVRQNRRLLKNYAKFQVPDQNQQEEQEDTINLERLEHNEELLGARRQLDAAPSMRDLVSNGNGSSQAHRKSSTSSSDSSASLSFGPCTRKALTVTNLDRRCSRNSGNTAEGTRREASNEKPSSSSQEYSFHIPSIAEHPSECLSSDQGEESSFDPAQIEQPIICVDDDKKEIFSDALSDWDEEVPVTVVEIVYSNDPGTWKTLLISCFC